MSATGTEQDRVLSTLNADGTRRWLRPRPFSGKWLNYRQIVGWALIVIFVVLPHLRIAGRPPLLIDIVNRELTIFGNTLYPTDTFLLAFLLISTALTVFFFTAVFGRVWCGWACPQTVYMELVYRPIERLFEGTPGRAKPGPLAKVKFLKLVIYFLISVGLANTFISYFVGTDSLSKWMLGSPFAHPIPFAVMAVTTIAMMFDFTFFREQTCIVACPYGRFQSVMLDQDSIVVGYDRRRGEPRGRKRRVKKQKVNLTVGETDPEPAPEAQGDCIDCTMCVQTCPTGIDIRDGLQLECINCTQCIDACDSVMDKIGKPRGLIRYASQHVLDGGERKLLRPRLFIYPSIILILLTTFTVLLLKREPVFVSVVRGPGLPFTLTEEGTVLNSLSITLHDRTQTGGTYTLVADGVDGATLVLEPMTLEAGEISKQPALIEVPREAFMNGRVDLKLKVTSDTGIETDVDCRVLGPRGSTSRRPGQAGGGTPASTGTTGSGTTGTGTTSGGGA